MQDTRRSIFREEAVRRYMEGAERAVLPRLVSPHTFAYLWFLLGLLSVSSLVAWFTQVPMYASGAAVVVRWHNTLHHDMHDGTSGVDEGIAVAAFFPPQHFASLQTTPNVFLSFDTIGDRLSRAIITVGPKILSPAALQQQFALNAHSITQPAVVALVRLEPVPNNLPAAAYVGSVGHAEAAVGSQRLVSLLPLIGQLFTH